MPASNFREVCSVVGEIRANIDQAVANASTFFIFRLQNVHLKERPLLASIHQNMAQDAHATLHSGQSANCLLDGQARSKTNMTSACNAPKIPPRRCRFFSHRLCDLKASAMVATTPGSELPRPAFPLEPPQTFLQKKINPNMDLIP